MLRETVAYFPSLYSIYATFSIGFFDGLDATSYALLYATSANQGVII